jgi:hypothetical protein
MPNMKTVGQRNFKLLDEQAVFSQGTCNLDLWPGDLKINRDHPMVMSNLHGKYEEES